MQIDADRLARARIRPVRTRRDAERAAAFLKTPLLDEILAASPEERGCARLLETDGELVAALLFDPRPLRVRGVAVRSARVVETDGEDGRRRFRETGDRELFDLLVEEFLGYLWARRYPLAYAHGELALYPAHGFVPCFHHPRVTVPVAAALDLDAPYRVRHLKSDDVPRLLALRAASSAHKPQVFASGVPRFHHFCIEAPDRSLKGYFSLEVTPGSRWTPPLFAPEVEVEDRAAAFTLLAHCARKAADAGLEEMHFPVAAGHPLGRFCLELGGVAAVRGCSADPTLDEEMLYVVDVPRLVEALAPALEEAARGMPETSRVVATERGRWRLSAGGGRVARVREADAEPDLAIPHWRLVQLLCGYRGADELDADLEPETRDLLETLFPKTWPYSMCDPDHWGPAATPVPYSEAGAAAARTVVLPWSARA